MQFDLWEEGSSTPPSPVQTSIAPGTRIPTFNNFQQYTSLFVESETGCPEPLSQEAGSSEADDESTPSRGGGGVFSLCMAVAVWL